MNAQQSRRWTMPSRGPLAGAVLTATLVVALAVPRTHAAVDSVDATAATMANRQVHLDAEAQRRAGLAFEGVKMAQFGDPLPVIGQVVRTPGATVEIKSILEGRVEIIHIAPGTRVRKGDRVVTLHSHALHRLQGELLEANEALRLAENLVAAGHELLALEGISKLELGRRQQESLRARIALQSITAELEDLGYQQAEIEALIGGAQPHPTLTVRAPCDGVVLELAVHQHAWVQRYESLLTIGDPARLELELQIPPAEASSVARGDRVSFAPVGQQGARAIAEVITPVPSVDPLTRTVTIRARIVDGLSRMLAGVYIEGTLERGLNGDAPSVSESAVIRIDGGDHVFVRLDARTFEARPVVLGRYNDDHYEILHGLEAGEEVAVGGVFLLKSALARGTEG